MLHDGPPYANGDLHMGHALNKILKDIINRYKVVILASLPWKSYFVAHGFRFIFCFEKIEIL